MTQPQSQAEIDAMLADPMSAARAAAPVMEEPWAQVSAAPLETLMDVSLPVTIEFGRTAMTVQEVLQLSTGSVIQLQRMVGEPIDIYVSDRKLAEGEVVVVGEHFGVRITRLVGTTDAKPA